MIKKRKFLEKIEKVINRDYIQSVHVAVSTMKVDTHERVLSVIAVGIPSRKEGGWEKTEVVGNLGKYYEKLFLPGKFKKWLVRGINTGKLKIKNSVVSFAELDTVESGLRDKDPSSTSFENFENGGSPYLSIKKLAWPCYSLKCEFKDKEPGSGVPIPKELIGKYRTDSLGLHEIPSLIVDEAIDALSLTGGHIDCEINLFFPWSAFVERCGNSHGEGYTRIASLSDANSGLWKIAVTIRENTHRRLLSHQDLFQKKKGDTTVNQLSRTPHNIIEVNISQCEELKVSIKEAIGLQEEWTSDSYDEELNFLEDHIHSTTWLQKHCSLYYLKLFIYLVPLIVSLPLLFLYLPSILEYFSLPSASNRIIQSLAIVVSIIYSILPGKLEKKPKIKREYLSFCKDLENECKKSISWLSMNTLNKFKQFFLSQHSKELSLLSGNRPQLTFQLKTLLVHFNRYLMGEIEQKGTVIQKIEKLKKKATHIIRKHRLAGIYEEQEEPHNPDVM